MGVDIAALGLMTLARAGGADFSRVATIGRQAMEVRPRELGAFFSARGASALAEHWSSRAHDKYCEPLLQDAFGAQQIVSFDASDYEQADVVHDMNKPLTPTAQFPMVLDFGTLEHVFNVAVAFDNVAALCAEGGRLLHVLPGNNLSGHGFFQFSPEFFFQVYAPERGFEGTRVFAALAGDSRHWCEIRAPRDLGARVNLTSKRPFYLLTLTRKVGQAPTLEVPPVQQSDYVGLWRGGGSAGRSRRLANPFQHLLRTAFEGVRAEQKARRLDVRRARQDVRRRCVLDLTPWVLK